ncbi:superoxide dismutase family protein [Clostridium sp. AM58-1XD]|uniref:superoxide dismutase family protein n=1 Tax=Clostridium sp. AM58-1XD TaxID=2292307 RepID=UPI000E4F6FB6|nr:superoxide dismutase family protein [Clostridium sp. AM58-1XD]RGY97467.1 superoxide dismutase family protein [Clostridium sp. AM58-1XD]
MANQQLTPANTFQYLLMNHTPAAMAWVRGGEAFPQISGLVKFYTTPYQGVLISAEIFNLPNMSVQFSSDFYGMHIHEFGDCTNLFQNTGDHYNPADMPHPDHAGDLLPLLGNQGYAWMAFYDKRFTIDEIIGRSVVIHQHADNFTSQPSGDSGNKIACGVIRRSDN